MILVVPCSNLELSSHRVVKSVSARVDGKAPTPELLMFVPLHRPLRLHLTITRRTLAKSLPPSSHSGRSLATTVHLRTVRAHAANLAQATSSRTTTLSGSVVSA